MAYTNASKIPAKLDSSRISQMTYDLNRNLNEPKPEGWFFKWFSKQKIISDKLRTQELHSYIESVRMANLEKAYLEKQEQIAPNIVEEILLGDLQKARLEREKMQAAHDDYLQELKDGQAARRLQLEEKIADIDGKIIANKLTEGQVKLLDKIVSELDINNISPAQAFVLVKSLNPMSDANVDFASQEVMLNAQIEDMRADTMKKLQEAKTLQARAELESFNTKMTKKEFGDG